LKRRGLRRSEKAISQRTLTERRKKMKDIIELVAVADFYRDFEDEAVLGLGDYKAITGEEATGEDGEPMQIRKGDKLLLKKTEYGAVDLLTENSAFVCDFPDDFADVLAGWSGFFKEGK